MRIAHIVCSYPPYFGGMGNVVFQLAEEQGRQGHQVTVLTPGHYETKEIAAQDAPTQKKHAPALQEQMHTVKRLAPSASYGNAARLPQITKELDGYDIVHLHYPFFGTANMVRRFKKKNPHTPLVVTYHMDTRATGWKGLVFALYNKFWMPRILKSADALIGSSLDYIQHSQAAFLYATHKQKWHGIPFGVDTNRFMPREKPDASFAELGLDPVLPTCIFVGCMDSAHFFKGIPILLKALYLLKKGGMHPQMILVGGGNRRATFEAQAKALGLSDMVRFVGRVSDASLPTYYNMADLLVLPSTTAGEAFGMVLLEAMASGVPVLASDIPGVRTVAQDGGDVVPPRSPGALAEAIAAFFSQDIESFVPRMHAVRAIAEQKYAWGPIAAQIEAVYTSVIKK